MIQRKKHRRLPRWTPADVNILKKSAGKQGVRSIARQVKRSTAAVYQKASALGISLRLP